MSDMLVRLYAIEYPFNQDLTSQGISIKRGSVVDKDAILGFIRQEFPEATGWIGECEYALFNRSCWIAVRDHQIIGFACYDATAKGFFGPTGVAQSQRGHGIGLELLLRALWSMREAGYAYAIIGWAATDAISFYERAVGATLIEDSTPDKTIYWNLAEVD
ncbi:MAG: GNAT family N-acetyltransferase [Propionibacteriaceae bacterium]|jgi:GNAT superfamily N-acetyltransferase|nr:GNAT family N-acetyltransferase [Propionibacteriaceae bacterium]